MFRIGNWFKRVATGFSGTQAQPIVINADAPQRIQNAAYRVDHVRRYLEQSSYIPPDKMRILYAEMVENVNLLYTYKQFDLAHHDRMIALVSDARKKFGKM